MAEHTPINWVFPFKLKGADGAASKDITNPETYYAALAQAKDGFYPMGANGNWHGGVHFDEATGAVLDQSEVRCIADGEVIAYRIDEPYPTTTYGEGTAAVPRPFATGFVLVKHRLELPPKPVETSADGTTAAPTTAPALTFYSLYMHLLDWTSYQAQPTLPRPGFWGAGLCKVKPDAPDKVRGLNVREHHKPKISDEDYEANNAKYQNKLATLPRGTRIETGEAAASPNHNWRRLIRATPAVEGLAENTGWVYVLEAKELAENQYLVSEDKSKDIPALEQIGLHVRESANASSNVLAVLPRGTEIRVSGEGNYVKLEAIVSGNAIPPLTAGADGKLPGYVWLESLEAQCSPNDLAKNNVYPLTTLQRIKAGELIGHIGQYQNFDDDRPRPVLHLEVFSCEDVPAFIAQSKAWAENLPADQKTLIKIHIDSVIKQPTTADTQITADCDVRAATDSPSEGCWTKVQRYVVLKAKKAGFGDFDGTHNRYPMDSNKKAELANEFDLEVSELPDTVDFLLESYKDDGSDMYPGKVNIPSTHVRRMIGVKLNTPVWVKRSALNAQGRRASTSAALEAWTSFPLSHATDGPACGFERILSKASWSDLSTDHKAIDSDTTPWWYVTVAKAEGQEISGWVPEVDPIITKHSPWEWPGFSLIEDTTPIVSRLAGTLSAEGVLSTEETHTYAAQIDEAERGALFQRLFEIIDQPDAAGVRDKKLTPAEIKTALSKPWLAQQLSLLITHYESEWFSNPAKWNELDPLMAHTPGEPNPYWEKEKQRIEKLSWWATLAGNQGINADGKVWHFQTAGLIANCIKYNCSCLNIEKFVEEYKKEHQEVFGWFEAGSHVSLQHPLNPESEENLKNLLKMIIKLWGEYFDECNDVYLAYMLATVRVESYDWNRVVFFGPICEKISYAEAEIDYGSGPTGRRVAMAIANHNTEIGDGFKYRGRGLVQITWKIHYEKFSTALGIDFTGDPELALNLESTTRIMLSGMRDGIFSHGNTLAAHLSPSNKNYFTARKIINGSDRANVFKFYAEKFETLISRIKN